MIINVPKLVVCLITGNQRARNCCRLVFFAVYRSGHLARVNMFEGLNILAKMFDCQYLSLDFGDVINKLNQNLGNCIECVGRLIQIPYILFLYQTLLFQ